MTKTNEMDIVRKYIAEPPTKIVELIRELGLAYNECDLPDGKSGQIEFENGRYTISVNKGENSNRKRFTLAHELAHYLFHRDMLDDGDILNRHTDILFGDAASQNSPYPFSPSHEVEANKIAAQLLMPENAVKQRYDRDTDNVADLAAKFGVSRKAMEIRLKVLGLRPST